MDTNQYLGARGDSGGVWVRTEDNKESGRDRPSHTSRKSYRTLLRPCESKGSEESNGKLPQNAVNAKNNHNHTPDSSLLEISVGLTLLFTNNSKNSNALKTIQTFTETQIETHGQGWSMQIMK
ncbi:hypothetical protein PoB_006908600 [Plakobranchus ocellatus]|uniref:Uncharacterized protein n=1 Tax=Plakobranchus ocellatus TaxID=259542 RepID=A0AAV4DEK4_9GAST|nr:hypothetical protein PoB_006908600 [Plakobranchus ocellatus]